MFSTDKGPEQLATWSCKSVTLALTNIAAEQRTIEVCKGVLAKRTRRKPEPNRSVALPPQGGTAARHWSWRSSFGTWRPVLLYEIDRHASWQKLIIVAASGNGVRCAPRVCKHPAVDLSKIDASLSTSQLALQLAFRALCSQERVRLAFVRFECVMQAWYMCAGILHGLPASSLTLRMFQLACNSSGR